MDGCAYPSTGHFLSCQNSLSAEMHQPRPAINVGILLAIVVFVVGGYGIAAVPPSRPRTHQSEARQCSIALWLFRCEAPFAVSLAQVVASDCLGFEPIDRCGSVDAWAGAGERLRALPPNGLTALQAGYLHGGGQASMVSTSTATRWWAATSGRNS